MLKGFLVFVFTVLIVALAEHALHNGFEKNNATNRRPFPYTRTGLHGWGVAVTLALIAGTTSGLISKFGTGVGGWAIVLWLLMLGAMVVMAREFWAHGTEWSELFVSLAAVGVLSIRFINAGRAVQQTVLASAGVFLQTAFDIFAWLLFIGLVFAMLLRFCWRKGWRIGAIILVVIAILLSLLLIIFGIEWSALGGSKNRGLNQKVETWYQVNAMDPATVPGNFGPTPEVNWEKVTGKDLWNLFKDVVFGTGRYAKPDVGIGVAFQYYNDSATGKRQLQYPHENDTENINEAVVGYMAMPDSSEYERAMNILFESIEQYNPAYEIFTGAELIKRGIKVEDQMYADYNRYKDPNTEETLKLPVVWDCSMAEDDHFLRITYRIKGRLVTEWLHIECLFQACNTVEAGMHVEVERNPKNPKQPEPTSESTPDSTEPDPTSAKNKEPVEDPVNQGNADRGGGENKPSDGSGAVQSEDPRTTETPTGSDEDNHHGYADPATVTPTDPTESPEHTESSDQKTEDEVVMDYEPDPKDTGSGVTPSEGDDEYTMPNGS